MTKRKLGFLPVKSLLLLLGSVLTTQATLIDFDDLDDGTVVTTQYAGVGVTFSGGAVFQPGVIYEAGISLAEAEFPPYSDPRVLVDQDGPITGSFSGFVDEISGRFTYAVPVTLTIYDALDNAVGSFTSSWSENYVSSGNLPNELFELSYGGGIARFEIVGDTAGMSFALDDLWFSGPPASVPDRMGGGWSIALLGLLVGSCHWTSRGRVALLGIR